MAGKPGADVVRICKKCGEPYHPNSTRQQCCNKPIKVPCVVCGKLMDQICTFSRQNSTCSKECSTALGNIQRETTAKKLTRKCKWCGKEFHPKSSRDVYCDDIHYATCEVCGKQFEVTGRYHAHNKTCSDECRYISAKRNTDTSAMVDTLKATMLERYGVENIMQVPGMVDKIKSTNHNHYGVDWYTQTDEYKNKVRETSQERYGVDHYLSAKEVQDKRHKTVQEKYGVDNVFQDDGVKDKIRITNIEKFGVSNPGQSKDIQDAIKMRNVEKYGVEHPMMLPEYQEKAKQTNFERFGYAAPTQAHIQNIENWYKFINNPRGYIHDNYTIPPRTEELAEDLGVDRSTVDDYLNRGDATDCVRRARSLMEDELVDYIKTVSPDCRIITNNRTVLNGSELDIYLPDYKFAIECNPTVTHNSSFSDPWGGNKKSINYHKRKTDKCAEHGIFLLHVFGYEWTWHKDIIKSMIANIIGANRRLYARKCSIVIVPSDVAKAFLQSNHRQGYTSASVYLGLQYDMELVSIMTFGKMRSTIGTDNSELSECWELSRFCSKLNTSVIGGASKLFKYFISEYHPKQVRSFSDRSHTRGALYGTLGFTRIRQSDPNYVWVNIVDDKAYHRINAQKKNIKRFLKDDTIDLNLSEREIMESHGYARVYDSGTITWEWTISHLN